MSVVRVGHEATSHPGAGNHPERAWAPQGERMTAASTSGSPQQLLRGGMSVRRTRFSWGETVVLGEVMDECGRGARRGIGRSAYARVAAITSGRAISQARPPVHEGFHREGHREPDRHRHTSPARGRARLRGPRERGHADRLARNVGRRDPDRAPPGRGRRPAAVLLRIQRPGPLRRLRRAPVGPASLAG